MIGIMGRDPKTGEWRTVYVPEQQAPVAPMKPAQTSGHLEGMLRRCRRRFRSSLVRGASHLRVDLPRRH